MPLSRKELITAHLLSGALNQDPIDMKKRADLAIMFAEYLEKQLDRKVQNNPSRDSADKVIPSKE